MAIIRKTDKPEVEIPAELQNKIDETFQFQALRDWYKKRYQDSSNEVVKLFESSKVTVVKGEAFKTPSGMVIISEKRAYDFDVEVMWKAVEKGKVTQEAFLNCISGFDAKKVKAAFHGIKGAFEERKVDDVISFRAEASYKTRMMKALKALKGKDNLFKKLLGRG